MKDLVKVSVVIPAYNAEKYIEECIKSVINQTVTPIEIIIINDGSTDNTISLVENYTAQFNNIKCISKINAGLSEARNTGIEASTGDYIAFLDSDDIWHPTKLARQLEIFEISSDELGLVYSAYELCDQESRRYQGNITAPYIKGDILNHLIEKGNLISGSGSGVMVKRSVLEKVGLFDSSLDFAEDLDMWIRVSEKYHVDFVDDILVIIRTHTDSMQAQYTSHYSRFLANWPLYSKHSKYFISKKSLRKIRFDTVNAALNSMLRGNLKYQNTNTLQHAKSLMLGNTPIFNNWFMLYLSIAENILKRGLFKIVISGKKIFAKN